MSRMHDKPRPGVKNPNGPQEKKVSEYFKETDSSYQNWGSKEGYALHYGYHDEKGTDQLKALLRMNEIMAEQVDLKRGDTVLDAGCGVGASSIWMAKQFGAHAYGISLSPLQIKKAKAFAAAQQVQKLTHFSVTNFLKTGFPNNSFDVVWFQESSSQTYEKAGFLKEAYRVLKPGGRVIVTDLFLTKEKMNEIEGYAIDKWCDGWAMAYLPSIREFGAALKKCGYGKIRSIDNTKYIEESAHNIYVRGKEGYPDDILTKAKTIVRIKHTEANAFQKIALDMGLWKHLTFIGQKPAQKK